MNTRTTALTALFAALAAAVGFIFVAIPNLEFITATIFIGGAVLGIRRGMIAGGMGELIFSLLNPYGMPALPILLSQVMVMALVGGTGGVFYRVVGGGSWGWRGYLACGAVGMVLTALFDLLTTLSFALFMFGWEWRKIAANLLTGLSFYLFHIIINTLSFAVVVPLLLQRLESVFRSADDRKGIL